jgi:DNA replication protein DnaD
MVAKAYEADYGKPFDIEGLEMWQDDDETEPSPAALRLQELRDRRK